jgi:RNA polymerase sigma factor (sigma-70 family)
MNVEDYLPLVDSVVAKFSRRGLPANVSREDLHSVGVLGLIDAANRFDPSKGVPFECYARLRIGGAIADDLKRTRRRAVLAPFVPLELGEGIRDESDGARDNMEGRESVAAVFDCLNKLPDHERNIVRLYYFDGLSGTDIARAFGVTRQRISFILKAAIQHLRRLLSTGPDAIIA